MAQKKCRSVVHCVGGVLGVPRMRMGTVNSNVSLRGVHTSGQRGLLDHEFMAQGACSHADRLRALQCLRHRTRNRSEPNTSLTITIPSVCKLPGRARCCRWAYMMQTTLAHGPQAFMRQPGPVAAAATGIQTQKPFACPAAALARRHLPSEYPLSQRSEASSVRSACISDALVLQLTFPC